MKVLTKNEAKLFRALAQAFLPRGGGVSADAVEARVAEFMDQWMSTLPTLDLLKVRFLFGMFEYWIAVSNLDPFLRFTKATSEQQAAYLSSWESSDVYAKRLAFQGIRSMLTIAFCQDAGVQTDLGIGDTDLHIADQTARLTEAAELLQKSKAGRKLSKIKRVG